VKQVLQNARTGKLELADVPAPSPDRGQILVRTCFSVVSPGTDKLAMDFARKSLLGKARSRPDLVRQVTRKLRQEGPLPTYRAVRGRLDAPQPLGYSSAGIVEAVGADVEGFAPGDRVACAGAGYANHAELAVVPENLAARVPDGVALEHAAFATLGAIAIQGLRVAAPTLGEVAAVVGLGLIGQLAVQCLRANGCRVLGIDLDAARAKQALGLGAEWAAKPDEDLESWRRNATGGHGADLVVVTASSDSSEPLALAAELCRSRGRISLVGAMPIQADRRVLYDKELELRMSTSYGPGRYERTYEEEGLDYPLPHVRWTENRNLQAFLGLVAAGSVRPGELDVEPVPFEEAVRFYEELASGERQSLAWVFRYRDDPSRERTLPLKAPARKPAAGETVSLGVLGAGNYAKSVLLPALASRRDVRMVSLATATGPSARGTAERFGFATCGTDPAAVIADPEVDLILVATRHDSHAELATQALSAGKAVWLEKPVGLDAEQVAEVVEAARASGAPLAVGYNRRFSSHARAAKQAFADRSGPLALHYRVSAGPPPAGTWILDPRAGGGRIVGEACHFVDLCSFVVGAVPRRVFARALGRDSQTDDSMIALLEFGDGSTATLEYLAQAGSELPKEHFEIHGEGRSVRCDNFRTTTVTGGRTVKTLNQDKGQAEALNQVLTAVRTGAPSPFGLEEIAGVSLTTFAILESARRGEPVEVPA
jgi:polar amino acid transport system substrate-binding protein